MKLLFIVVIYLLVSDIILIYFQEGLFIIFVFQIKIGFIFEKKFQVLGFNLYLLKLVNIKINCTFLISLNELLNQFFLIIRKYDISSQVWQ